MILLRTSLKHLNHILLLLLFCSQVAFGQTLPEENAILNYRIIGFNIPRHIHSNRHILQIAEGHITDTDSFQNKIFAWQKATTKQVIETVPEFGHDYTWRVSYIGTENDTIQNTPLYHFRTGSISYIDTGLHRLHVTIHTPCYNSDLLIFSDCNKAIYDINGQPLWYLPAIPGILDTSTPVRDLKISPFHTITFIANTQAYEVDYNGHLLWRAPDDGSVSGDTSEYYHHEFTRLQNGGYMIAGNQHLRKYLPSDFARLYVDNENIRQENGKYYVDVWYGTLIQYDSLKNIIWSWKSDDFFTDEDLLIPVLFENNHIPGFHFNSFFFDEKRKVIYCSFRDINRIIKLQYPSKKVAASYGKPSGQAGSSPLFVGQHNCRINKNGNLYLFNNNFSINKDRENKLKSSSVLILKENDSTAGALDIISSFQCNIDSSGATLAKGGGSVYEMQNSHLLVCMGTANRIFIIGKDKVQWNAFTEQKNEGRWLPQSNYRVSAIEGLETLKRLIFNH